MQTLFVKILLCDHSDLRENVYTERSKNFLHSKEYLIMVALIFSARYLNENSLF